MAESAHSHQWLVASEILAAIYNTVRDPKKRPRPFTGNDFNPTKLEKQKPIRTVTIEELMRLRRGKAPL
ncbi:MAG: hypothetical protein ABGX16_01370 [Pirellulales bacterium]